MTAMTQEMSFQFYLVLSNELRMFFKKIVYFLAMLGLLCHMLGLSLVLL